MAALDAGDMHQRPAAIRIMAKMHPGVSDTKNGPTTSHGKRLYCRMVRCTWFYPHHPCGRSAVQIQAGTLQMSSCLNDHASSPDLVNDRMFNGPLNGKIKHIFKSGI